MDKLKAMYKLKRKWMYCIPAWRFFASLPMACSNKASCIKALNVDFL